MFPLLWLRFLTEVELEVFAAVWLKLSSCTAHWLGDYQSFSTLAVFWRVNRRNFHKNRLTMAKFSKTVPGLRSYSVKIVSLICIRVVGMSNDKTISIVLFFFNTFHPHPTTPPPKFQKTKKWKVRFIFSIWNVGQLIRRKSLTAVVRFLLLLFFRSKSESSHNIRIFTIFLWKA